MDQLQRYFTHEMVDFDSRVVESTAGCNIGVYKAADVDRLTLRWTTERPTVPGWYWWRSDPKDRAKPVLIVRHHEEFWMRLEVASYVPVATQGGEFAGPIAEPVAAPEQTGGIAI